MRKQDVLLIAMPWQHLNRPSIQLGALKAYLKTQDLTADLRYLNLEFAEKIGFEEYNAVAKMSLDYKGHYSSFYVADLLSAYLLYPENRGKINGFLKSCGKSGYLRLIPRIKKAMDEIFNGTDWGKYGFIGFTTTYFQVFSSLYFAKRIKTKFPRTKIIFGGVNCAGAVGKSLIECFPAIDYVVDGEGELALTRLLKNPGEPGKIPNLVWRGPSGIVANPAREQLKNLSGMAFPDYDDYFRQIKDLVLPDKDGLHLPLEASRGCWYTPKCTYCSFNCIWDGYRTRTVEHVAREIKYQTRRHKVRKMFIVDSVANPQIEEIIRLVRKEKLSFSNLYLRVPKDNKFMASLAASGVTHAVMGIEALSASLLKKMGKGNTVIENIQAIKWCEEQGINLSYNLIPAFPTEVPEEVAETIENISYVKGFKPPNLPLSYYIHLHGSSVAENPEKFNIRKATIPAVYHILLPPAIRKKIVLPLLDITLKKPFRHNHEALRETVREWRDGYTDGTFKLVCRQRGDWLAILDYRSGEQVRYVLSGLEKRLYAFCSEIRTLGEITRELGLSCAEAERILAGWREKKLVFREGVRFLALAVDARLAGGRNKNK